MEVPGMLESIAPGVRPVKVYFPSHNLTPVFSGAKPMM
jgi:hypothetical protein